jgi:hypothetical protein
VCAVLKRLINSVVVPLRSLVLSFYSKKRRLNRVSGASIHSAALSMFVAALLYNQSGRIVRSAPDVSVAMSALI